MTWVADGWSLGLYALPRKGVMQVIKSKEGKAAPGQAVPPVSPGGPEAAWTDIRPAGSRLSLASPVRRRSHQPWTNQPKGCDNV